MDERGITLAVDAVDEPTTDDAVFYNTEMVTNRDISVACLAAYQEERGEDLTVCDAMAASGIRGLRYLDEVDGLGQVILNDINPGAVENIEQNRADNDLPAETVTVLDQDANVVLSERFHSLDMVDIDPFGSPVPYLDSAARSLNHQAALGVTATDLGPLYGSYPKVCRRRYGAQPLKNAFGHETGIRILIAAVFQACSRYDLAFEPLVCHHERHYHRIFGRVQESKKQCNRSLEYIGFLDWCPGCDWRGFSGLAGKDCPHCGNGVQRAGPLWTGPLGRPDFGEQVAEELEERGYDEARTLVDRFRAACRIRTPFYDTHELASVVGVEAPRKEELLTALQDQGYRAVETHFTPQGIRTDAPIKTIHAVLEGER